MGEVSEDAISSVIEALLILSKEKISQEELLILVDDESTAALSRSIREGEAFSDDFNAVATASGIWSAVIRAVEGGDLLGSGLGELAQLTSALPVHLQRLLGGLLSVSELLAQENSNNVGTLVQSMRRVLGVNFPQAHMLELFKNYRNHFAYAYMFTRRLGRTPNAPPQVWEKELAVAPAIDKTTDDSDLIGRNEKVGSRRTVSDADASDQESVSGAPNTDPKWLVSDSEEGEDSEDEELMEHRRKAQQKKRMTRMSASPARRAQPGVLQTSRFQNKDNDEKSMVIEDLSFSSDAGRAVNKAKVDNQNPPTKKSDDKSGGGWSSASTAASKESSGQRKSLVVDITRSVSQDRPDSVASFNSFDDSDTEIHQAAAPISMMAQVDIEDLRNVYQNSITAPGASYAQKQTLARNIRFALAADELSDRVMQIGGTSTIPHVTWQMLLNIAGLAEEKPRSKSSEAAACLPRMETADENLNNGLLFDGDKSVPNRKSLKSDDDSEAYVDSLSHQRSTSSNMNAPLKIEANDPVDMAITLFKKIDRDSNGVVTHVELIKALRGDSKLASALQLPSHIRQEDGSRDSYMNCFNEIDKDGTGNISLMEFLQFMENCREQQTESHKSTFRSFQSLKGVRSIEAGSPMAPANKPIRILDPEDRRAGVTQQPQVKSGPQTLESKRMQSQYVDSQKISLVRSNSDSGNKRNTREFNSLNGPSSAVHRRQIRATDLDESAGRPSPPKMLKQSAVRTSLNQSMESVHSGTLSIKHRRLVGGESVGSEHMPGDTRAEITLQDQSFPPSKPPLNPFVMAHVSHIDDMPPVAQDIRARSEFAEATNTIFEGYLDKKSQMLGLWQKRYFVLVKLKSSATQNIRLELRIYTKTTASAWGMLPMQLRRVMPLGSMQAIDAIADKKKIGTLFKIVELIPKRNATVQRTQSANDLNTAAAPSDTEQSEMDGDIAYNGTRIMTLRAVNPEIRLAWITTLRTEVAGWRHDLQVKSQQVTESA